jgi:hypothetical protein
MKNQIKRQKYFIYIKTFKLFYIFLFFIFIYYLEYTYFDKYNKEEIIININKILHIHRLLTTINDNITLVSGYFKIKSKHNFSLYSDWISNFLKINHSLVFFVDDSNYQEIISKRPKAYRNKTIWIKTNISDFYSYKNYYNEFSQTHNIDLEKKIHSVPLYLIWAEKIHFLKLAVLKNFFKSKCFYWVDAGCFRNKETINNYINNWPSEEKCFEDGRVLFNDVQNYSQNFKDKIKEFDIEAHHFLQKHKNVDGSSFGGQKEYILKFNNLYYDALIQFLKHGIFIGKDQNIFAFIAYSNEDIVKLVFLKEYFELQNYLKK